MGLFLSRLLTAEPTAQTEAAKYLRELLQSGHSYSYIDRSARKGKSAPYYLEVVQRGGTRIMFGPAIFRR